MDSNTAMKMLREYSDCCERVLLVEKLISAENERIRASQRQIANLHAQLEAEVEKRDNCHAFARSAVNSLTPVRGFTV